MAARSWSAMPNEAEEASRGEEKQPRGPLVLDGFRDGDSEVWSASAVMRVEPEQDQSGQSPGPV